jgi:hypothetical protein
MDNNNNEVMESIQKSVLALSTDAKDKRTELDNVGHLYL